MTQLARLYIQSLRNISEADLDPGPGINLFFGENGSGKTSVLEAVYMLSTGRSFRSHLQRPLIQEGQGNCAVFAALHEGPSLGVQRSRHGAQAIKIGGAVAESLAQLSQTLPLMLLNGDSFSILDGGPSERRRFMDWGVFHVKHEFQQHWKHARLALKNRNQLLKHEASPREIQPWTQALAQHGEQMHEYRQLYMQLLQTRLSPLLSALVEDSLTSLFSMEYEKGWDESAGLMEQLEENLGRDRKQGHTTVGPHRADIKFRLGKQDAANLLSRGQMKLLLTALKFSQATLLKEQTGKSCVLLIDDLPSELDAENLQKICSQLSPIGLQVFLACIDPQPVLQALACGPAGASEELRMFHVKRGRIATQASTQ